MRSPLSSPENTGSAADAETRSASAPLRWDLIGAALGFGLGAFDLVLFRLTDTSIHVAGREATLGVMATFAITYAAFGWVIGRLVLARRAAREATRTIERQMTDLEQTRAQLIQSEKLAAIGELAATIAHEVRNPLGVIRASASLLQEGAARGNVDARAAGFIVEEVDRLDGLIRSLLAFARPEAPALAPVSLATILERAVVLSGPVVSEQQAKVEVASDELRANETLLEADEELLGQLLAGLVVNAVQATGPKGHVELRSEVTPGSSTVAIDVADDGPGVAPEHRTRVFDPFFTTRTKGTGLGLANAVRVASAHGGTIELVPDAGLGEGGRGARFRLTLPLRGRLEIGCDVESRLKASQ